MIDSSILGLEESAVAEEELPSLPIWTFTLGVLALLTLGLTSVPAIICGHRALKKAAEFSLARSVTVTGLVIAYVGAAILCAWIMTAIGLVVER